MSDLEDEDVTATSAAWEDGDTGDMVEETVCHSDFSAYAVTHPEADRNLRWPSLIAYFLQAHRVTMTPLPPQLPMDPPPFLSSSVEFRTYKMCIDLIESQV